VFERNSPHVGMQYISCQNARCAGELAEYARVNETECAEDAKLVAGVAYEAIQSSDGREKLAVGFHTWLQGLEGEENADELLAATFRTLFTLMMLNRLGLRHNDAHLGNVLMGPASRGPTGRWAYFPDHAGVILLDSERNDADVDRWLQTCPNSGFERSRNPPPGWAVSHLRRILNTTIRVRRESPEMSDAKVESVARRLHGELTKARAKASPETPEFWAALEFASIKLARLGIRGSSWFLLRDAPDVVWPYLVDWDWASFPRGRYAERLDRAPPTQFENENPSAFLPAVNNAHTLDTKGDAYLFAASAWPFANWPAYGASSKLKVLLNEMAPRIRLPDRRSTNVLVNNHPESEPEGVSENSVPSHFWRKLPVSPSEAWQHDAAGAQMNRFCPGPVDFDTDHGRCVAKIRLEGGRPIKCSRDESVYGKWTLPDCAFKSTEDLFEESAVLSGSSGGPIQRFRILARSNEPKVASSVSNPTRVDGVFGDWMRRRTTEVDELCRIANLSNSDGKTEDADERPFTFLDLNKVRPFGGL
jgi:hypothetical protein